MNKVHTWDSWCNTECIFESIHSGEKDRIMRVYWHDVIISSISREHFIPTLSTKH